MRAGDNPFRSERVEALDYLFVDTDWESVLGRLVDLGMRGAVVGPEGSGKTTFMEQLSVKLRERGFIVNTLRVNLDESGRRCGKWRPNIKPGGKEVVILDGAEQLTGAEWRRFMKITAGAGGVIVSSHCEGLLPTFHRTRPTVLILDRLLESLAGGADLCLREQARELFVRHEGNIRCVFRDLYDRCSGI